jgi:cytoskeletal protein RodZ
MIGWRSKPSQAEVEKPKGFDDFELRLGDLMRGERATLGKSLLDVQRELKIKATYIAAIENADVSAFETPGFVAGYVRSYARYLGMDPETSFQRFCAEANFAVAHGMSAAASTKLISASRSRADYDDPLANPNATFVPRAESVMAQVEPGAIGSIAVLVALIAALGYGGWSLLQEVQRVQLAPIDEAPTVVAEIDPLGNVSAGPALKRSAPAPDEASVAAAAEAGVAADPLDRLYRPKALDVPVLTARDGPIAAINPRETGVLAVAEGTDAAIEAALGEALDAEFRSWPKPTRVLRFWPCVRPGSACRRRMAPSCLRKSLMRGNAILSRLWKRPRCSGLAIPGPSTLSSTARPSARLPQAQMWSAISHFRPTVWRPPLPLPTRRRMRIWQSLPPRRPNRRQRFRTPSPIKSPFRLQKPLRARCPGTCARLFLCQAMHRIRR